jgi:copper chaperone CopZ
MITEDSRKIIIMTCQHELKHVKARYKLGLETVETLRAVSKALEHVQVQVQIEANKEDQA